MGLKEESAAAAVLDAPPMKGAGRRDDLKFDNGERRPITLEEAVAANGGHLAGLTLSTFLDPSW